MSDFENEFEAAMERTEEKLGLSDNEQGAVSAHIPKNSLIKANNPEDSKDLEDSSSEPEPKTDPQLEEEEVKRVLKSKDNPKRDKSGKFTKSKTEDVEVDEDSKTSDTQEDKTDLSDQEVDVEKVGAQEQETQVSQDTAPIEPPMFWSAERKALFAKAQPELKKAILDYEAQRNEYVNRITKESERGRTLEKRLNSDFSTQEEYRAHMDKLKLGGLNDEIEELHRYRAWNRSFDRDPIGAAIKLLQNHKLTPYDLMNENGQVVETQEPSEDPRIIEAQNKANEAIKKLEEFENRQKEQSLRTFAETFKNGKDSRGQVRKPFAEFHASQIDERANLLMSGNPYMSLPDAVNQAYEEVLAQVSSIYGLNASTQAPQAPKAPQQAQTANVVKAKAAASSVTGGPSSAVISAKSKLKGKTWNEIANSAIDFAEESARAR